MADKSSIEWTEATWNPLSGCTKVSPGCAHCYAEVMANRLKAMGRKSYQLVTDDKGRWNGHIVLIKDVLEKPLHWKKPRKIFVNSMTDLFHDGVPEWYIQDVFDIMRRAHWHTFQVLTKRSERLAKLSTSLEWPENVWMGVSVESTAYKFRIDHLRRTGAWVKFLSVEPLLGWLGPVNLENIQWVIVGGESGPKARPMHPAWAEDVRDQCVSSGTAFLFKQWGAWYPTFANAGAPGGRVENTFHFPDGQQMWKIGKHAAGRLLDGRTWDEYPNPEV